MSPGADYGLGQGQHPLLPGAPPPALPPQPTLSQAPPLKPSKVINILAAFCMLPASFRLCSLAKRREENVTLR